MIIVQPSPTLAVLLDLLAAAALLFALFSLVHAVRAWSRAPLAACGMAGFAGFFGLVCASLVPTIGWDGAVVAALLAGLAVLYFWPALSERHAAQEERP